MYTITLSLNGRVPSKKNQKSVKFKRINGKRVGVPRSSRAYYEWNAATLRQFEDMGIPKHGLKAVKELELTIYFPDQHQADLTNKAESIMDTLVDYGFLEDDKWQVCPRIILIGEHRKNLGGFKVVFRITGKGESEEYLSVDQSGIPDDECVDTNGMRDEIIEFESFDL